MAAGVLALEKESNRKRASIPATQLKKNVSIFSIIYTGTIYAVARRQKMKNQKPIKWNYSKTLTKPALLLEMMYLN